MLDRRRRRRADIIATLGERLVFAGLGFLKWNVKPP